MFVFLFLLVSCAHNKVYDYAEYQRSFTTGMEFYSQYEIIYKVKAKKGEMLVTSPFLADSDNFLPKRVQKLHLALNVVNPNREKFTVWIDSKLYQIGKEEKCLFSEKKIVYRSQSLPSELISIDLPYATNIKSKIRCSIIILGREGIILYQSSEAKYKIKGVVN